MGQIDHTIDQTGGPMKEIEAVVEICSMTNTCPHIEAGVVTGNIPSRQETVMQT